MNSQSVGSYVIAPGEVILHNGLEITFTHAVAYTGLLVRSDPSYPVVLTGFLVILLGMFISFYCYPRFISYADGTLRTASRRNGWVFHHSVRTAWDRWQKTHRRKDEQTITKYRKHHVHHRIHAHWFGLMQLCS